MSSTGIDVPNLSYRSYLSVRYRYESLYRYRWYRYPCRTELTEVSGTGIDVVPNLPKYPVPVIPAVYTAGMPRYVPNRTHPCKFNFDCAQDSPPPGAVTSENVYLGMRVMRGLDWNYRQQVKMFWETGLSHSARSVLKKRRRGVIEDGKRRYVVQPFLSCRSIIVLPVVSVPLRIGAAVQLFFCFCFFIHRAVVLSLFCDHGPGFREMS